VRDFVICPNVTKSEMPFQISCNFRIRVTNACECHEELQKRLREGKDSGRASGVERVALE